MHAFQGQNREIRIRNLTGVGIAAAIFLIGAAVDRWLAP